MIGIPLAHFTCKERREGPIAVSGEIMQKQVVTRFFFVTNPLVWLCNTLLALGNCLQHRFTSRTLSLSDRLVGRVYFT